MAEAVDVLNVADTINVAAAEMMTDGFVMDETVGMIKATVAAEEYDSDASTIKDELMKKKRKLTKEEKLEVSVIFFMYWFK